MWDQKRVRVSGRNTLRWKPSVAFRGSIWKRSLEL